MNSGNDEELDYVSSAADFMQPEKPDTKPQDEFDLPVLKRLAIKMEADIASYKSTDRLSVSEKEFTVKQQLAMNQAMAKHIVEYKQMVESTVNKIKEKYER